MKTDSGSRKCLGGHACFAGEAESATDHQFLSPIAKSNFGRQRTGSAAVAAMAK